MTVTRKHRPKGDSCGVSFGSFGKQPGNLKHNRRRALLVRMVAKRKLAQTGKKP